MQKRLLGGGARPRWDSSLSSATAHTFTLQFLRAYWVELTWGHSLDGLHAESAEAERCVGSSTASKLPLPQQPLRGLFLTGSETSRTSEAERQHACQRTRRTSHFSPGCWRTWMPPGEAGRPAQPALPRQPGFTGWTHYFPHPLTYRWLNDLGTLKSAIVTSFCFFESESTAHTGTR